MTAMSNLSNAAIDNAKLGTNYFKQGDGPKENESDATVSMRHFQYLDIAATAVEPLLMLDLELNDEILSFVAEGLGELGRDAVELVVLAGLDALGGLGVVIELGRFHLPLTLIAALEGRLDPALVPARCTSGGLKVRKNGRQKNLGRCMSKRSKTARLVLVSKSNART